MSLACRDFNCRSATKLHQNSLQHSSAPKHRQLGALRRRPYRQMLSDSPLYCNCVAGVNELRSKLWNTEQKKKNMFSKETDFNSFTESGVGPLLGGPWAPPPKVLKFDTVSLLVNTVVYVKVFAIFLHFLDEIRLLTDSHITCFKPECNDEGAPNFFATMTN